MIIDTHVHFIKPFDSQGNRQVYTPNPSSAEEYVALMDIVGIDRAFFISWSPEDIPSDLTTKNIDPLAVRETMSREYAIDVMQRFPDRFYWFPCHLGPGVPDFMNLAKENLRMGAAGLKLVLSFWGELPDDPRVLPMYDLAEEFEAQVIIDTSFWYLGKEPSHAPETLPEGHRQVAMRIRDFPDYARHLRAVFEKHPGTNFQLAHAGARRPTPENCREVGKMMHEYPNVFADLGALPLDSPAVDVLIETAGADRVMFGTDWPHFAQGPAMQQLIDHIRKPGRFSEEVVKMILGENALRFVKNCEPGLACPESVTRGQYDGLN
jgi:predicted TIM-barrel fold metal-dependent hydrolase